MENRQTQPHQPWYKSWQSWLSYALLLVVAAAVARPVCDFIELFCAFSHMGST